MADGAAAPQHGGQVQVQMGGLGPAPGDRQRGIGHAAQLAVDARELGLRDGGNDAEGEDLAVRTVDGRADRPPVVLEDEDVSDVLPAATG